MKNNDEIKRKAKTLRAEGLSYNEISNKLGGIPKSTLSFWLKSVPLTQKLKKRLYTSRVKNLALGAHSSRERRAEEVSNIIESAEREITIPLSEDSFKAFGAALYWAEGTKKGQFEITNSDPLLIFFMVKWIGSVLGIDSKILKAKLNIYSQQNDGEIKKFWSELCGVPVENFGKSYVKPLSKNYKKNNLYYGTIKIIVPKSTDMKYRTFGFVEAVLSSYKKDVAGIKRKWNVLRTIERPVNLD